MLEQETRKPGTGSLEFKSQKVGEPLMAFWILNSESATQRFLVSCSYFDFGKLCALKVSSERILMNYTAAGAGSPRHARIPSCLVAA